MEIVVDDDGLLLIEVGGESPVVDVFDVGVAVLSTQLQVNRGSFWQVRLDSHLQ